jgi:lactobin A/cerein 7B family class IIb bacteriocin
MRENAIVTELSPRELTEIDGGVLPLVFVIGAMGAAAVAGATAGYFIVSSYLAAQSKDPATN